MQYCREHIGQCKRGEEQSKEEDVYAILNSGAGLDMGARDCFQIAVDELTEVFEEGVDCNSL